MCTNSEIVKYLAKKAELDIVGGNWSGPLHIASKYPDRLHLVKILVDAGADVNLADPVVGTPLQSACSYQGPPKEEQESLIFYLINEAKVDLGIVRGSLGCAFNAACRGPSFGIVRLMLEKGARIDVRGDMGRMAIHLRRREAWETFKQSGRC